MDLSGIVSGLQNCPCGRKHTLATKIVEISSGAKDRVGAILAGADFPKKLLLVADENTMEASRGILDSLGAYGFETKKLVYKNMLYARVEQVREVEALTGDVDGIISVGTGSLNDICRVAAFEKKKRFCIFATAPSMDGFASDGAPIIENNFKTTWHTEQPEIIIADTAVLAKSPVILKSAGFGDMVAKYIGIVDWKISNLLTGEYYCPAIADITMKAVGKIVALADKVTSEDEETAGSIMEGLVLTGVAMKLAGCSRPASGAEHVLSHFWECHKVARGIWPEFHGLKVGVATVYMNRIYRNIAERVKEVHPVADPTNWDEVWAVFTPEQAEDVRRLNDPTVTDSVDREKLRACWPEIRKIILETLPTDEKLMSLMKAAGAATKPEDVHVDAELFENGLRYHSYMRHRILLTRLLPMLGIEIADYIK